MDLGSITARRGAPDEADHPSGGQTVPNARPSSPRSARSSRAKRNATYALIGVLVVFTALATVISVKTPAFESADEPSHVQNIEALAAGKWYRMNSNCGLSTVQRRWIDCEGVEAHQAPLYYLVLAGWQRLVGLTPRGPFHPPTLAFATRHGLFARHSQDQLDFLLWLRLPNVLFGALTVLVAFAAVREVTADPWTPVVGASIVAFLPRFVFLSAFVTNDNLVDLLGAVLALVALRYVRAPSRGRIVLVGLVVGLLLTTKLSTLPIVLVLALLPIMVTGWKKRAGYFAFGVLGAVVTCGWYLIQNAVRYGDPIARAASSHYLAAVGGLGTLPWVPFSIGNPLDLVFDRVPHNILNTFWYQSGWDQFYWSWPVNLLFWLVLAACLAGLVRANVPRNVLLALTGISIAGFLSVWLVSFETETYQARYVFVGLAALAALAALGVEARRLPVRFILPAMGLCGTLVALQQDVLAVHWI